MAMAGSEGSNQGDIVAFEGPADVVATQLRLLPPSPQLMILPNVESYMTPTQPGHIFDAKAFVKRVHEAYNARQMAAQAFFSDIANANRRVVFLSGGRPAARMLCIQSIMEHETGGDRIQAEALFDEVMRDGVAGLCESPRQENDPASQGPSTTFNDDLEDPTIKAMRAADALDRETAALQPPAGLAASRPRSLSLPLYGFSDEVDVSTPLYMFGVPQSRRASLVDRDDHYEDIYDSHPTFDDSGESSTTTPKALPHSSPSTLSRVGSLAGDRRHSGRKRSSTLMSSPVSETFSLGSTDIVVFGEAALLDVRSSVARQSVSRVKSLDRIYPLSPRLRDLGIPAGSWLAEPETPVSAKPQPLGSTKGEREAALAALTSTERPRTVQVKTRIPEIRLQPAPQGRNRRKRPGSGSDSDQSSGSQATNSCADRPMLKTAFEPIFAGTEEVVIVFQEGAADPILHATIQALKNDGHPMLSHSPTESESTCKAESSPCTPEKRLSCDDDSMEREPAILSPSADDYDPFAYTQAPWQPPRASRIVTKTTIVRPPTPAQTPPPQTTTAWNDFKVLEIKIRPQESPVSVQNSLRSTLEELFPSNLGSYHRFQYFCSPAPDVLWSPLFHRAKSQGEEQTASQSPEILAIGSRKGVPGKQANCIISNLESACRGSPDRPLTMQVDVL